MLLNRSKWPLLVILILVAGCLQVFADSQLQTSKEETAQLAALMAAIREAQKMTSTSFGVTGHGMTLFRGNNLSGVGAPIAVDYNGNGLYQDGITNTALPQGTMLGNRLDMILHIAPNPSIQVQTTWRLIQWGRNEISPLENIATSIRSQLFQDVFLTVGDFISIFTPLTLMYDNEDNIPYEPTLKIYARERNFLPSGNGRLLRGLKINNIDESWNYEIFLAPLQNQFFHRFLTGARLVRSSPQGLGTVGLSCVQLNDIKESGSPSQAPIANAVVSVDWQNWWNERLVSRIEIARSDYNDNTRLGLGSALPVPGYAISASIIQAVLPGSLELAVNIVDPHYRAFSAQSRERDLAIVLADDNSKLYQGKPEIAELYLAPLGAATYNRKSATAKGIFYLGRFGEATLNITRGSQLVPTSLTLGSIDLRQDKVFQYNSLKGGLFLNLAPLARGGSTVTKNIAKIKLTLSYLNTETIREDDEDTDTDEAVTFSEKRFFTGFEYPITNSITLLGSIEESKRLLIQEEAQLNSVTYKEYILQLHSDFIYGTKLVLSHSWVNSVDEIEKSFYGHSSFVEMNFMF